MNSIVVAGRIGNDSELRYTSGGTAVANFSVAVDKQKKNGEKQQPLWLKVTLWGKLAESLNQYLTKGSIVAIQGELEVKQYEKRDGGAGTSVEINARQVRLLGGNGSAATDKSQTPEAELEDEDIPF